MDKEYAKNHASEDCFDCGGQGWVREYVAPDDGHEVYCICVKEEKAQKEAESHEDA